jgi:hypothetical protein
MTLVRITIIAIAGSSRLAVGADFAKGNMLWYVNHVLHPPTFIAFWFENKIK